MAIKSTLKVADCLCHRWGWSLKTTYAPPPVTFFSRRRQSYSISKSTSSRQSRHILPKSVIFYLATDSGDYFSMLPHYLAKIRSSSFGISGKKCRRQHEHNIPVGLPVLWFLNTPNFNANALNSLKSITSLVVLVGVATGRTHAVCFR